MNVMVTPDDIPQDIWEAAAAALREVATTEEGLYLVARAIHAERERCAEIAGLEALRVGRKRTRNLGLQRDPYPHEIGNHIVEQIRGQAR
ncbi:MAG TPA: hypothetical protein VMA55_20570 [Acidovorax sp.]|nr:hypothetical protein [Acidovorax sp.]